MSSVTFHVESLKTLQKEVQTLGQAGYDEVDQHNDLQFNPDWDTYEQIEQQGMLRLYTVRSTDTLVGFILMCIQPNLHCKGQYTAASDSMYIYPKYRGCGVELIHLIRQDLTEEGVTLLSFTIKAEYDTGKFGTTTGTTHYENIYQCRLK